MMCLNEPAVTNFKRVYKDLPNITLLTKSVITGDIQVTFVHASAGNNYLGETVTAFYLMGSLESLTVVSIDAERSFASTNN